MLFFSLPIESKLSWCESIACFMKEKLKLACFESHSIISQEENLLSVMANYEKLRCFLKLDKQNYLLMVYFIFKNFLRIIGWHF